MALGLDLIAQPPTLSREVGDDRRARDGQELVNQLRSTFEERDALYELFERTVHNEERVKIPEAYQKTATEVYSPLAGHIVNTITAALSVNGQTIQFAPTGIGTGPTENATKREMFFEASWQRQERESRRRLLRAFIYSLVLKGEGVLKTVERSRSAWGGYREYSAKLLAQLAKDHTLDQDGRDRYYNAKTEEWKRLHAPYPIRTTDVLPETFYYLKGEDGFNACVEVKDVPYLDTLERFKMGLDSRGHVVPATIGLPLPEWQSVMRGVGSNIKMFEIWTANECFPGDTLVALESPVLAVSRRWYSGELSEVTTSSGVKLTGTPHHPVLTDRGWVGLGFLQEGDHVVRSGGSEGLVPGEPHKQDVQAPIRELFDLADRARASEVRAVTEADFHGDGQHGYVDVVPVDGELRNRFKSTLPQPTLELLLSPADNLSPEGLAGGRTRAQFLLGASDAGDGFAGSSGLRGALLGSASGVAALGSRAERSGHGGALLGAVVSPPARLADADSSSEGLPLDRVSTVRRVPFSGHVYNLHTESNRYIADGIIVHNCNYILLGPGQWKKSQGSSRLFGVGTVVRTIKNHGYGDPLTQTLIGPYFQALGTTTANRLPHKAGLGVLYGFLDLFKLLNNMLTIAQQNAVLTGFASFKKKRPASEQAIRPRDPRALNPYGEDGDEDDEDDEVIEPGYVYPDDIDPLEMPRAGIDFEKFIAMIRDFLELALPSVVQGVVSGDQSGYALNQAAHLARLAWSPILDNAQFALSDRVGFESRLIEKHIGETVYAWGNQPLKGQSRGNVGKVLSISPKDLNGHHNYEVKLDPQTPSNKQLELNYHDNAVKAGFESKADAIEALGGSPDKVEKQRMFEAFKEHPKVQERIFERAMQKLGWVDAQEVVRTQEELALAGANGDPTQPDVQVEGVFAPGVNMPEQPTPPGSVTGAGPPGSIPGRPMTPASLPAAHEPLPNQA